VETGLFTTRRSVPERFRRLQAHLLEFYPPEHVLTSVRSSTFPLFPPDIEPFPLSDLPERLAASGATGTLFIPPVSLTPFADTELAEAVNDITHLRQVTQGQAE
jgi:hypothetical protein